MGKHIDIEATLCEKSDLEMRHELITRILERQKTPCLDLNQQGSLIRGHRRRLGLSRADLALMANISRHRLMLFENGLLAEGEISDLEIENLKSTLRVKEVQKQDKKPKKKNAQTVTICIEVGPSLSQENIRLTIDAPPSALIKIASQRV